MNEVEALRAEINRLEQHVADLQSGMYVNCVYCGHRYGRSGETPVSMADVLKRHIAACPKHPVSKLLAAASAAHGLISLLLMKAEIVDQDLCPRVQRALQEAIASAYPPAAKPGEEGARS
jgi:hypothetical protein